MKLLWIATLSLLLHACSNPTTPENSMATDTDDQILVDRAIKTAGLKRLLDAKVSFQFREHNYVYNRRGASFNHLRILKDSVGNETIDRLYNSGFERKVNGKTVPLGTKKSSSISSSINSVMYFAFLPLWLNDKAVMKEILDTVQLHNKSYIKMKVSFREEGGGEDFEDVFLYWFDTENFSMDYLAYAYQTNGGGIRFREAYNVRKINDIVFQDYKNYKPINQQDIAFENIDKHFEDGQLELLSTINLENINIMMPSK